MFDFVAVLSAFSKNITMEAWETDGQYVDGVWQSTAGEHRIIDAIVLQSTMETLEKLSTGSVSDVTLGFHTYDTLYFSDIQFGGVQGKQSFVSFENLVYIVTSSGQFSGNVVSNLYSAVRYYNNDSNPTIP